MIGNVEDELPKFNNHLKVFRLEMLSEPILNYNLVFFHHLFVILPIVE